MATAWIVISQHAATRGVGDTTLTASRILEMLRRYDDGDETVCKQVTVASCPRNVDAITGQPAPKVMVGCRINGTSFDNGLWALGIIGTRSPQPVYITGYPIDGARLRSTITRDKCQYQSWQFASGLLR